VLVPKAAKIRRASPRILQRLEALRLTEEADRADAALYFAGPTIQGAQDLRRIAGVHDPVTVFEQLVKSAAIVKAQGSGQRLIWLHAGRLEENAERVVAALNRLHDAAPLQRLFDRSLIAGRFQHWGDPAVLDATLAVLRKQRRIQQTERMLGLSDRGPQLVKGEQELLDQLVERYRTAGLQPPTMAECREAVTKHQKSVPSLLKLAVVDGLLVEVGKELYLHATVEEEMRRVLRGEFQRRGALTVSDIRDILQVSRKYAVPFCEHLDRIGFTIREGDLRRLSQSGQQATV